MHKRRNQLAYKTVFCLILGLALMLPGFMRASAQQAAPPGPPAVSTKPAVPSLPPAAPVPPKSAQTPVSAVPKAVPTPPVAAAIVPAATPSVASPQPTPPVISAPLIAPVSVVSFAGMVRNSDPIVQAVMAILLLCSIGSWAAFVYKSIALAAARRNTLAFSEAFRGASTMDNAAASIDAANHGAAAAMWHAAKQEWDSTLQLTGTSLAPDQTNRLLQRLVLAMGSAQEQALSRMGNWMGLLATVGSTAPFIGLFGTVWGILDSFEHISASYNTSLSVVAPGIAEALLATAFGLFAAIPATMFYNRFAREIGKLTGMLDNLTAELVVFASRDVERLHR